MGLGNAGSVERMLSKAGGIGARITGPNDLTDVSGLIIPGVGSFDPAMSRIREAGFEQAIHKIIDNTDVPVLGICLGMHILCNSSEEGKSEWPRRCQCKSERYETFCLWITNS